MSVDDVETRELVRRWEESNLSVPLKVIASPYREITRPILDYVKRVSKESPRTVVTVFLPEYVVGHWWEHVLHNQSALRLKGRLLFMPGVMVTSVPWQLNSSERLKTHAAACGSRRCPARDIRLTRNPAAAATTGTGDLTLTVGRAGERGQLRGPPRRPGGVRPLRAARRAGAGAGHRGPGVVLARRGHRGDRTVGRPHRVAMPDRRGGRCRLLRSGLRRPGGGARAESRSGVQSACPPWQLSVERRRSAGVGRRSDRLAHADQARRRG